MICSAWLTSPLHLHPPRLIGTKEECKASDYLFLFYHPQRCCYIFHLIK